MSDRSNDKDDHPSILKHAPRASVFQRLRNNLLTGIVVVAPFGITIYLTWTIVDYVDQKVLPQVLPLIPEAYHPDKLFPFSLPGVGLLIFVLFLIFVGSFTKNFFGRELLKIGEGWVDRMPVVRSLYNALKQIAETIFTQSSNSFEKACLVEYPRRGIWAVAFISTKTKGEIPHKTNDGREMMSVFLPTTPNPTSGFLLFVPAEDIVLLDMTVEEAAKLIISAGLVTPATVESEPIETVSTTPQVGAGEAGDMQGRPVASEEQPDVSRRPYSARHEPPSSPARAGEAAARNPFGSIDR